MHTIHAVRTLTVLKICIHHTMVAHTKNLIKQCDYDNGVTEWQNNLEASD